jgi:Bifunctional DNA primase/polymerase, N-terminal/Primase C terminal 2 (PriCT-2)
MSIFESAINYTQEKAWMIFPVHGLVDGLCTCGNKICENPGKHPATMRGLLNATDNAHQLRILWNERQGLNVALATGQQSGVWVLDIDGDDGRKSLENLESIHGRLPETLTVSTGKGLHLYFQHPGVKVKSRVAIRDGLDVRGDGGYVILPPSKHYSGRVYEWVDESVPIATAPQWIVDMVTADSIHKEKASHIPAVYNSNDQLEGKGDWSREDVVSMLSVLDADMAYDQWLAVGMAINEGGFDWAVWDAWSRQGSKYQTNCTLNRWKGFDGSGGVTMGTLVDMAMVAGWKPPAPPARHEGPNPAQAMFDAIEAGTYATKPAKAATSDPVYATNTPFNAIPAEVFAPATKKPSALDMIKNLNAGQPAVEKVFVPSGQVDPLAIPGLIGETVQWICETAMLPQPEVALSAVLASLGAVFGRRYAGEINTRTNLYMVAIAESGMGKDHPRKLVKNLLVAAGLGDYLGADSIVTGAGLLTGLMGRPSQVMMLDEFGLLLQEMGDSRSVKAGASKVITSLYSDSGSVFSGGNYADERRKVIQIQAPNLCILGTSTMGSYTAALKRSAVQSGELNRFVVMLPRVTFPEINRGHSREFKPPADLVKRWAAFADKDLSAVNSSAILPEPRIVQDGECGPRLDRMLDDQQNRVIAGHQEGTGALWVRYRENAIKIAMIFAIARNPLRPSLAPADLDIADQIVRASVENMVTMANDHMYENAFEKDSQKVFAFIRKAPDCTRSDILRANRSINKKQLDDIISLLQERDQVTTTGSGRGVKYRST